MLKKLLFAASAISALAIAVPVHAAIVIVDAKANSSTGGVAKFSGLSVMAGHIFKVTSSINDLWSAGALPRFSDGSGLVGDRFATAADDSGQPVGTQIGTNFGSHNQNGISAPFGSLVGEIGGVYQVIGANFNGPAWGTGNLNLYYWDSNNGDNDGSISFNISAVPEPETWALMLLGFGFLGAALRRKQQTTQVSFG